MTTDHKAPPAQLVWRHAAESPIPEPEGGRALLIWNHGEAWRAEFGITAWGSEADVIPPGDRSKGWYWTWADGDPWTRRSKQARADEKLKHYAKPYGAKMNGSGPLHSTDLDALVELRIAARRVDSALPSDRDDPCPICGAAAGEPCKNEDGDPMPVAIHAGRLTNVRTLDGGVRVTRVAPEGESK